MNSPAYSYIRFSNAEQASGNSLERQLELAKTYALRKGLTLDENLTMKDLGVSAFTGKNLSQGALGVFLKAVTDGKIPTGAFLLIEDVDRLSRLPVMDALDVFRTIINAGITVVTLKDGKEYSAAQLQGNWTELMPVLVSMGRGFEESETKSRRIRDGWAKSKDSSRIHLKPHGANGPSWLAFVPATKGTAAHYVPIDEHVATGIACELSDVHVVWSSDNRITFTGDERIKNEQGQQVCYKQSWLCTLCAGPEPVEDDDRGSHYRQKAPPR